MGSNRLEGKVAIVTGTGDGIGQAIAQMFVRQGACVYACDTREQLAEAMRTRMRAEGHAFDSFHPCHLGEPGYAQGLIDRCVLRFGKIDVLVNVAAQESPASDDETGWCQTLSGTLGAVVLTARAAWPHLQINGAGSIINVAPADADRVVPGALALAHRTASAGMLAVTKQLALDGRPLNIRANAILPGRIAAAAAQAAGPLLHPGHADDIAYCATYLASDEARWVTGTDLRIDGGAAAR